MSDYNSRVQNRVQKVGQNRVEKRASDDIIDQWKKEKRRRAVFCRLLEAVHSLSTTSTTLLPITQYHHIPVSNDSITVDHTILHNIIILSLFTYLYTATILVHYHYADKLLLLMYVSGGVGRSRRLPVHLNSVRSIHNYEKYHAIYPVFNILHSKIPDPIRLFCTTVVVVWSTCA